MRRALCATRSLLLLALISAGCAAPLQRAASVSVLAASNTARAAAPRPEGRPSIGVALGGGSARGLAHVGVIRWFEEHRIPIDLVAGTSMGGLIGGSFATGMDAGELTAMVGGIDWNQMFGSSPFPLKNIRRKADARAYPSRLEFGLRGGLIPPMALNNGEQVELLLSRITAPYGSLAHFDDLPTPFRAVAVDLVTAREVRLEQGPLATAMRATMSLPLIFPPIETNGQVLVDGGAMNNVPANVVRAMGADTVVAVNVGDLSDREGVAYTLLGLAGSTLDAMMRASTRTSITSADIIIDVPLRQYGSLDWRRSDALIEEGYRAAEALRDRLLPLAVSEAEYERWTQARQARRRTTLATPTYLEATGFAEADARRLRALVEKHLGRPLDLSQLERDLEWLTSLDRYETVTWRLVTDTDGADGLRVTARPKPSGPPFMMLGLNLENTTSSEFRVSATARYLRYGVMTSSSELRVDATLGSAPGASVELYQPLGSSALFVAPYAQWSTGTSNFTEDEVVVARYRQRSVRTGLNVGVNLGARSDVRAGVYFGRQDATVSVGNPALPEVRGRESVAELVWRYDGQDSPVVPSTGTLATLRLSHALDGPRVVSRDGTAPAGDERLTQLAGTASRFFRVRESGRLFSYAGAGTSFDRAPPVPTQFQLGLPLRLGAFGTGELRGPHFYFATAGYLHQVRRLPDFIGGPVFVGSWIETGDAFPVWSSAGLRVNVGAGLIMDTLLGPVMVAGTGDRHGRWRTFVGVGRIFR